MRFLSLVLCLSVGQSDQASPDETWPQWRGPSADSIAPVKSLPMKWGKNENIVWKAPIPGWGTSTPAIWKDVIFVTTQKDESLLLLRLDRGTGKAVWEREVGRGTPLRKGPVGNGRFHDEHNMASPSPVTDGKHVWAHFGNGDIACYTFDGEKVWSENFIKLYGPLSIWWGRANSPLLYENMLISTCSQDPKGGGKSYVVAHHKLTGKEIWKAERMTGATGEPADSYTTPLLVRNQGQVLVAIFGGNVLNAYDPKDGKELWTCKAFNGNRVISGPTLAGNTIYAVQGMQGPLFAVKTDGSGDVTESHVRWKYKGGTPDAACPVFSNQLVFMANNKGMAICVDSVNGQELWKERLADGFRATPLVVGNLVYLFGKEGKAVIVEAARELKVLATNELGEDLMASPAVAYGDLYIRTKQHVYRIGKTK